MLMGLFTDKYAGFVGEFQILSTIIYEVIGVSFFTD
jgi:hypothetical protein